MLNHTATYSPEDNKLRLYPACRLDRELYMEVKGKGFKWAPKQDLFVAPMWTPEREDFLLSLCEEIDDEDKSLVARAEERSERFEDYSEKRGEEAERAHDAVSRICDGIPLGQPILVGHHSERRARRDAEKIENGMRRAIKLWETSEYWTERAKGAIRHAKYKERADVRARRIKGLEADRRKHERSRADAERVIKLWTNPEKEPTYDRARAITNGHDHMYMCFPLDKFPRAAPASQYEGSMSLWSALDGIISPEQARGLSVPAHSRMIAWCDRWISHIDNRLAYERAMLEESGGTVADRKGPEAGGAIRAWCTPGYGKAFAYITKVNKVTVSVLDNWGNGGRNFTRKVKLEDIKAVMSRAEVEEARASGRLHETESKLGFYLDEQAETHAEASNRVHREAVGAKEEDQGGKFDALKDSLKAGVQVVSAPQLFPTPRELAERMAEEAEIELGHRVLEPSAGTGNLLFEIMKRTQPTNTLAVEVNPTLCASLRQRFTPAPFHITNADFLECNGDLGTFDRILMNPPFQNAEDIKHIRHAVHFLRPGGRLVALCANGPRQREQLRPLAESWEDLPAGSFSEQGTNVNVALLVISGPAAGRLF